MWALRLKRFEHHLPQLSVFWWMVWGCGFLVSESAAAACCPRSPGGPDALHTATCFVPTQLCSWEESGYFSLIHLALIVPFLCRVCREWMFPLFAQWGIFFLLQERTCKERSRWNFGQADPIWLINHRSGKLGHCRGLVWSAAWIAIKEFQIIISDAWL